jgi:hypothetical protein
MLLDPQLSPKKTLNNSSLTLKENVNLFLQLTLSCISKSSKKTPYVYFSRLLHAVNAVAGTAYCPSPATTQPITTIKTSAAVTTTSVKTTVKIQQTTVKTTAAATTIGKNPGL